jgi:hypothetical protein
VHTTTNQQTPTQVWLQCLGALEKKAAASPQDSYESVLRRAELSNTHSAQIEKDLRRTLPTNTHFQKEEGIDALRCVLLAYSEVSEWWMRMKHNE